MRTRAREESVESRGLTSRNDGVHPVDGGSTGAVPSFVSTAEELGAGAEWAFGGGKAPVGQTTWFAPVEDSSGCKDGVCPVPWAVKEETPVLKPDVVYHPPHYTDGSGIECIEAIEAQLTTEEYQGYLRGNCVKYLWRWRQKGGVVDLQKAQWYLDRLTVFTESQKG